MIRPPRFTPEDEDPNQTALQRAFASIGQRNTGVTGTGFPMSGGTTTPVGVPATDVSRPPGTTPPPGGVVSTGPNTTNPGGTPGLEMGQGANFTAPGAAPPAAGTDGRRGWAGTSGTGLNLDMPTSRGGYGTLEGFNNDRAFAGGDANSVKDGFARWVTGLGFDPARASKEEIESVIRANMDSARQYGLNILDVNGEMILIETAERGPEWVDVVRGAGAGPNDPDAAWQWGAAADGGGGATGGGVGMQTGGGLQGLQGGLPSGLFEALTAEGGTGDDQLLQQIAAELQALTNGRPSPLTQTTLQRLLGGDARTPTTQQRL